MSDFNSKFTFKISYDIKQDHLRMSVKMQRTGIYKKLLSLVKFSISITIDLYYYSEYSSKYISYYISYLWIHIRFSHFYYYN